MFGDHRAILPRINYRTIGVACFGAVVAGALILAPYFTPEIAPPEADIEQPGDADVQMAVKSADTPAESDTGGVPYARPAMMIGIDPVTGQLRAPTAEEIRAMTASMPGLLMNSSGEGLKEVVKPDGSVEMDLQGRFQSFAVARIAQDGSVVTGCVTTKKEAEGFLNTSPTTEKESDDEK